MGEFVGFLFYIFVGCKIGEITVQKSFTIYMTSVVGWFIGVPFLLLTYF